MNKLILLVCLSLTLFSCTAFEKQFIDVDDTLVVKGGQTKKEILDQLEKSHSFDLPKNLVDHEITIMTQNLKKEDKDKHKDANEKLAKSRIKLGLLLNEYGEKNNLKVKEEEIKAEIQKQIRGMPGQEKILIALA